MATLRVHVIRSFALFVSTATMLVAGVARADIDWIIQPSLSKLAFSGTVGSIKLDANGDPIYIDNNDDNPVYVELYNAKPQTDAGTQLYAGFANSMVTSAVGRFASSGNNFLSSLNFGPEPAVPSAGDALTREQINGKWFPNGLLAGDGDGVPGQYGTATNGNAGFALQLASGYVLPPTNQNPNNPNFGQPNNGGDGGRVQLFNTYGDISSKGTNMTVTNGSFDASSMGLTGGLQLAINYNGNYTGVIFPFPLITGTTDAPDGSVGTITRGAGANSYQYLVSISIPGTLGSAFQSPVDGGWIYATVTIGFNITANANLAPGDVNFDGVVNAADVAIVGGHWLQTDAKKLGLGDASGDGVVNAVDIGMIGSHWLNTKPPLPGAGSGSAAAVPEPSSYALLSLGAIGLWVLRRRAAR